MTPRAVASTLVQWFSTLKFKIVVMAVVTGVLSAVATAHLVLSSTQASIEQLLLQGARDDRERTAAMLASKLDMLQSTLMAVARQTPHTLWDDHQAMTRFLADKAAINVLFDIVLAAAPDGSMLARLEKGVPTKELPNIADREYFQRVMRTDQAVISQPLMGKVAKVPLVIVAAPVLGSDGRVIGTIAGSLTLRSSRLFAELSNGQRPDGSRDLVMDRAGMLLSHTDPARVLGRAADEPGLGKVFEQWHGSGSPIDTDAVATLSAGYLVSRAGIPASDWVLVRLTPQAAALAPVDTARQTVWRAAAGVGFMAALLAGWLAWRVTRPISSLRARAESLLTDAGSASVAWPQGRGEVGDLSRAFQHVVEQRQRRQAEIQALVQQLEAVLDHAEVGIALTRDGRFELVSRHFCRIFRCDKQQAVGQPTRMIYASDEAYQALAARARPSFIEHGAFDGELKLMRRSGDEFWAHLRGRAVAPGDPSQGTIWIIEDVTEVREHRERLAHTASHDALTGLANRAAFEELLEHATARSAEAPFCTLFIDLDRFKQVNDTGGHAAGDAMLRDVAHALVAQVRRSDTVARLGGDEFAVLLADCPVPQAQAIADKLRAAVLAYRLRWEGRTFSVGASVGLVPVNGGFTTAADVLRAADAACYAAKRQGRNRVEMHDAESLVDPAALV